MSERFETIHSIIIMIMIMIIIIIIIIQEIVHKVHIIYIYSKTRHMNIKRILK